jgi:hypothetical protein
MNAESSAKLDQIRELLNEITPLATWENGAVISTDSLETLELVQSILNDEPEGELLDLLDGDETFTIG